MARNLALTGERGREIGLLDGEINGGCRLGNFFYLSRYFRARVYALLFSVRVLPSSLLYSRLSTFHFWFASTCLRFPSAISRVPFSGFNQLERAT